MQKLHKIHWRNCHGFSSALIDTGNEKDLAHAHWVVLILRLEAT